MGRSGSGHANPRSRFVYGGVVADKSKIQWTEATWNPTTGCSRISPGCQNCYALTLAARLKKMGSARYQNDGDPKTSGPGFGLTLHPDSLDQPLRWKRPRRIFVNSMSDLFHPDVPFEFVFDIIDVMAQCPQHTFQVLTKRPQRMQRMVTVIGTPPNAWWGTSIENDTYTFRADHLRKTPAAVRFLSLEPLLGPLPSLDLTDIGWVIVGAESGRGARPMDEDWVREIRDRCVALNIPFFYKQNASGGKKIPTPELDGRVWTEYPLVQSESLFAT